MIRVLFLHCALALVLGGFAAPAFAGDPPTGGTLNRSVSAGSASAPPRVSPKDDAKDWRRETEATCGMACRYHRANDNLTMQALYLVTKIGKVDDAIQNSRESEARTALGAFCKSDSEEIDACFSRYKDFQRVGLLELRQAIGKNEDTIARLTANRKADGTVEGTAITFESGEAKTPYLPEVPTLSELEESYLKGNLRPNGSKYSRAEIQKWSQDLVVNNPNARYLQFQGKAAVGNPYQEEKSSYSLYLEDRDAEGKAAGEDKRAVGLYKKSETTIREFAEDKKKEIADREIKVVAPTKNLAKDDKVTYDAFVQARSVINGKLEADVKRVDQEEKDRRIANDAQPKPKPSASPSGTPSPVAGANPGASRDVKVTTGNSAIRAPSAMRTYGPDETVERPKEMKNSRYIKYDLGDLLKDADDLTK